MSDTVDSIVEEMRTTLLGGLKKYKFASDVEDSFKEKAERNVKEYEIQKNNLDDWSTNGARTNVRELIQLSVNLAEIAQQINAPNNPEISWKQMSHVLEAVKGAACPIGVNFRGRWCDFGWLGIVRSLKE